VVGAVRALELFAPSPSTVFLADWSARLGQDLFAPPNVGGWPGGRVWVSAQASIARANYAAVLVGGRLSRGGQPLDALGLARKHGRGKSLDDLSASGLADRVAVMAFSEFGRTVAENFSAGTDHGTAGPVFVLAPKLTRPLLGDTPSLTDLDPKHGDLRVGLDFRRVYATFLDDWLGLSAEAALGQKFERLSLFHS